MHVNQHLRWSGARRLSQESKLFHYSYLPPTARTPPQGPPPRGKCLTRATLPRRVAQLDSCAGELPGSPHFGRWRIDTYPMPTPFSSPACSSRPRSDATTCLSMIRKRSCGAATRWPPPGAIVGTSLSLPSAVLSAISGRSVRQSDDQRRACATILAHAGCSDRRVCNLSQSCFRRSTSKLADN